MEEDKRGWVEEGKIGNIAEGLVRLEDEFVLWRCIAQRGDRYIVKTIA